MSASHIETLEFHGIPAYRLTTAQGASAVVSRLGAQVLSWCPPGGLEQLFLSERAVFDGSRAIRGGMPVCFPQFSGLGPLPKHGLVRTRAWTMREERCQADFAMLCLGFADDGETRALWPHPFAAELTVVLEGPRLDVELSVENTGTESFEFTAALHSYLRVAEVEETTLKGLRGFDYRDAAKGDVIRTERAAELEFGAETDRVYHEVSGALLLKDRKRSLGIHQEGFPDVVVWNPWEALCATLPDMAPLDFRHMLCVEAAAARVPVRLPAGQAWVGRQSLVVL